MNMQQMMAQAQKMKRELQKALNELATQEFTVNKNGAVTITMLGNGELKSVNIDNDAVKDDKEMVEDLIVAGVNELKAQIKKAEGDINESITGSRGGFGGF